MRLMLAVLCLNWTCATAGAQPSAIAFTNGRWFNGREFEARVMYAVSGVFQSRRPSTVDTTIDLHGGYVVPPFGEAHNHNIDGSSRSDITLARYIAEGIFYVMNPNSLPRSTAAVIDRVNKPNAVDVIFANGGLNVSGGHPSQLAQRNIERGSWKPEDGEGGFYHTIDDRAALDAKWTAIVAGKPDFIKIYLLFSNEYAKRKDDSTVRGVKGLDPALVPEIVRRAHEAGLRVGAHIENVADFRTAVASGVDVILHMAGYGWLGSGDSAQFVLSTADAMEAARRRTSVVTTLGFGQRGNTATRTPSQTRRDAVNAANLRTLKAAAVSIAIGSDNNRATSQSEALYLSDLAVWSNLELLKVWSEATPSLIFPKRRIGALRDGYEASFIVLEQDPLQDFGNVLRITRRVKQGNLLP
jgi:predicted amidohydrolase YtcJ